MFVSSPALLWTTVLPFCCGLLQAQDALEFTVSEDQGISRAGEPVRIAFPASGMAGSQRLENLTARREEAVQRTTDGALFLCSTAAHSQVRYRLSRGKAGVSRSVLQVSGDDLAWKVETAQFVVDLSKNPGTGRNGQINTILVKELATLLSRGRPTSTLHLSPNSATGGQWNGINRWNPPEKYSASQGPISFRLEREGSMPFVPDLRVRTVYEFFADSPAILVEEFVEATGDARISLLRLCEWSLATGTENSFSHVGWEDARGKVEVRRRDKEEALPLDLRWMGFFSERLRLGFAAVLESLDTAGAPLEHSVARFSGEPHYFYRTLISAERGTLITVPRGARYGARYRVYCYRPADAERPFDEASRFCQGVRNPLRVSVAK